MTEEQEFDLRLLEALRNEIVAAEALHAELLERRAEVWRRRRGDTTRRVLASASGCSVENVRFWLDRRT